MNFPLENLAIFSFPFWTVELFGKGWNEIYEKLESKLYRLL